MDLASNSERDARKAFDNARNLVREKYLTGIRNGQPLNYSDLEPYIVDTEKKKIAWEIEVQNNNQRNRCGCRH